MLTVSFFFTEGVSYKATNVQKISSDDEVVEYSRVSENADGTIIGIDYRVVDKTDLLYAVVKDQDNGEISILPGMFEQFDIVPKGAAVNRQKNIEAEAKRVADDRAAKAPAHEAKEAAKYAARRAKRKAEYLGTDTNVDVAPSKSVTAAASTTPSEQLSAVGISEADIEVLRSLNIMK